MDLSSKRVIVTGGVRGLGRSMVDRLVAKGAAVTVFDIDARGLSELTDQQPQVDCVQCDVSNYEKVSDIVASYHGKNGAADVLINNAGILHSSPLFRITSSGIDRHDIAEWN